MYTTQELSAEICGLGCTSSSPGNGMLSSATSPPMIGTLNSSMFSALLAFAR